MQLNLSYQAMYLQFQLIAPNHISKCPLQSKNASGNFGGHFRNICGLSSISSSAGERGVNWLLLEIIKPANILITSKCICCPHSIFLHSGIHFETSYVETASLRLLVRCYKRNSHLWHKTFPTRQYTFNANRLRQIILPNVHYRVTM